MNDAPVREDGGSKRPALGEDLFPELYEELRLLASHYLSSEPAGHTLQATALVHEAWLRLGGDPRRPLERSRFYCAAAKTMRRILIHHARDKSRLKRGGAMKRVELDISHLTDEVSPDVNLIALDAALERLASQDERKARLVELRYFAGLDQVTTAEILDISVSTLSREWTAAKAWLQHFMEQHREDR